MDDQINLKKKVEDNAVEKFIGMGFFKLKFCPKCSVECRVKERKRTSEAKNRIMSQRCPKCSTFYSLYDGTVFGLSKKPLYGMLQLYFRYNCLLGQVGSLR